MRRLCPENFPDCGKRNDYNFHRNSSIFFVNLRNLRSLSHIAGSVIVNISSIHTEGLSVFPQACLLFLLREVHKERSRNSIEILLDQTDRMHSRTDCRGETQRSQWPTVFMANKPCVVTKDVGTNGTTPSSAITYACGYK